MKSGRSIPKCSLTRIQGHGDVICIVKTNYTASTLCKYTK